MGKRKGKKKKRNRYYQEKQIFYNKLFEHKQTRPGEIRKIALDVFGSYYYTTNLTPELASSEESV